MTNTLLTPRLRLKNPLFRASLFLASATALLLPSLSRADVTVTVDKGKKSSEHKLPDPSTNANNGGGGGKGKGGGGGASKAVTDTVTGSIFYTITVTNLKASPAAAITLEYHVYNKTTTSGGPSVPPSSTVDDITGTSTFDLAANAKNEVETSDIPYGSSNTTGGGGGGGGKKGGGKGTTTISSSSTNTSVMGWIVYIKDRNGKVIHTYTSDDTIQDKVAKLKAKS